MASVTLNGVTYTDDSNAVTGLANGGHRTRFVPALSNFLAEAAIQIALAADQVDLAAAQVALAADQVGLAEDQVALAADQVTLATAQKTLAAASAVEAASQASAAAVSAASTVYAGVWASLTGPLSPPATVAHASRLWALTVALADVTTAEPGVSAAWFAMGGVNPADTLFINFFLA